MPLHTSEMTDEMLMAINATRAEHASQQRDSPPPALSPAEQRLIENRRQRELADAELPAATSRQLGWMLHRGGRRSTARSASPPERRRRRPLSADAGLTAEPAVGERRSLGELKKVLWLERQRQQQAPNPKPHPNPHPNPNPNPNPNPHLLLRQQRRARREQLGVDARRTRGVHWLGLVLGLGLG